MPLSLAEGFEQQLEKLFRPNFFGRKLDYLGSRVPILLHFCLYILMLPLLDSRVILEKMGVASPHSESLLFKDRRLCILQRRI